MVFNLAIILRLVVRLPIEGSDQRPVGTADIGHVAQDIDSSPASRMYEPPGMCFLARIVSGTYGIPQGTSSGPGGCVGGAVGWREVRLKNRILALSPPGSVESGQGG